MENNIIRYNIYVIVKKLKCNFKGLLGLIVVGVVLRIRKRNKI